MIQEGEVITPALISNNKKAIHKHDGTWFLPVLWLFFGGIRKLESKNTFSKGPVHRFTVKKEYSKKQ